MKNALDTVLGLLHRRFAAIGLAGALAITVMWWIVIVEGVRLAIDWAFV